MEKRKAQSVPLDTSELRRNAEREARHRGMANIREMSPEAVEKTVHELQVHQIELELQNDELVRTRQELEESRNKYLDLYDLAPAGYCTLDRQAVILEANLTLSQMLGVERERLLKRKILVFMPLEDRDSFYSLLQEVLEQGRRQKKEVNFIRGDESRIVILADCVPQNSGGRARLCMCSLTDISDRKRYEELLRLKENEYRSLVQGINSIIFRMDPGGTIRFMNRFGLQFFGYLEEELVGKPAIGAIFPERDSKGEDMRRYVGNVLGHPENIAQSESEAVKKNGERVWVRWTNQAVFDDKGDLRSVLSSGIDISFRKREEEALRRNEYELRTLVDNSPDIIFRLDRNLRYVYVNPTYERITGLPKERFIGKTNEQLEMSRQMAGFWRSLTEKVIESGREGSAEFELSGFFGKRYFSARLIPEFDKSGLVETVLVIARDITDRKHAEEEIASLKK